MLRQRGNGISTQCNDTARDLGIRDTIAFQRGGYICLFTQSSIHIGRLCVEPGPLYPE